MRKQLTLKKLTLFVLSTLLCLLLAIAGITLGSSTQAFADEPTTAPDTPAENPSGHDATHDLQELHVIYPATCVEPGIAVAYCNTCGRNVSVVLDADGVSHSVPLMLKDESGAETIDNSAEGVCELCGAKTGGFNRKVVTEGDDQYVEVSAIEDSALTSITIPAKLAVEEGGEELPVHVKEGAFEGNDTIKEVTIQGAVEVGENAFKDCPNLDTLTIQNGTEIIGANAFEGCEKIAKVELPASVVSIGEDAFNNTGFYNAPESWTGEDLKTLATGSFLLKVATAVPTKPAAPARARRNAPSDSTASYTVADSIKVIADGALKALTSLTEVNLPAGLKTVGKDAFNNSVTTIYIGSKDVTVTDATAYTKVDGLNYAATSPVDIYYWGDYDKSLDRLAAIARLRFLSETEPNDEHHNYWYHNEKGAPAAWAHLEKIEVTNNMTEFLVGDPFVDDDLVVTAYYDEGEPKVLTRGSYTQKPVGKGYETGKYYLDTSKYVYTTAGGYVITVNYLYRECSYTVTVVPSSNVTINYNGNGQATESHSIPSTKPYTLPKEPNHYVGYTFAGWLVQHGEDPKGTLMQAGQEVEVNGTEHITITAQWTAREPDVKMNYDKGVQGTAQFTAEFDKATETYTVKVSGTPTRTGYTFTGWDYDANGTKGTLPVEGGSFDVALADTMTVTVTAKWTVVGLTPTVSYDNGEKGTAEVTAKFDETKESYTVTVSGTPTRTGYKFLGWTWTYKEGAEGNTEGTLEAKGGSFEVTLADEMTVTVTARWEQLYTVSVGTAEHAKVEIQNAKDYYATGATVTFTVTVDNGYKLAENGVTVTGATLQDGTYTFTVGTDNVTIAVKTVEVKVTLVWMNDGAELKDGYATQAEHKGATATVTASKTPTKTGYTFKEWSVSYGETSTTLAKDGTLTLDLGNKDFTVTLTATWTRLTPTVEKVDLAGGSGDVTTSYTFDEETNSYTVTINGTPTYDKHRFDGWTVSGDVEATLTAEQNTFTVALADNMTVTITAKWVDLYTLTVPEIANASVSYEGKKDEYEAGETVKITITPADGYKVTDITVDGAEENVEGNVITVTFASSDVTVTVTVSQVTVTVAFAETYEGVSGSATVDGATATVTITGEPTKEGYAFTGWTSSVDGGATQGVDVLHYNLKNSDVTITFTAQFEEKEVTEVNATLSVSGTTVSLKLTLGYKGYTEAELKSFKLKIGDKEPLANTSATVTADSKTATLTFELPEELTAGTYALKLLESDKEVYSGKTFSGSSSQFVATTGLEYTLTSDGLTVTFYGISEKPLTVTEALAIAEAQCVANNSWTRHPIYATGKVRENPTASGESIQFELVDPSEATKHILVFQPQSEEIDLESIAQNDVLVIYGSIENYYVDYTNIAKLEFTGWKDGNKPFPEIKSRTAGPSTITLGDHTGATVTGFDAGNTLTITNDTTFTFTVTPEGTNWIYSVKAGNETLTANEGNQYSFKVAGDATITVKALKSNEQIAYKMAKSDDPIVEGAKVVFVSGTTVAGAYNGSKFLVEASKATFDGSETITKLGDGTSIWTLHKEEAGWQFINESGQALGASAKSSLKLGDGTMTWTISIAMNGKATVKNTSEGYGSIQYNYNSGNGRFMNYTGTQSAIQLYVETTVTVPYTYNVTKVSLEGDTSLSLKMTISKQPVNGAPVSLTVGGQKVEATLEGDVVTSGALPLESLTNGAEIVLKIDDVAPTSWGEVDSNEKVIESKYYSLFASDAKLQLKIVDPSAPEFSYNVTSIKFGATTDGTKLSITFVVDADVAGKSAKLTINDQEVDSPKVANGNEFTFEVTPGDWDATWTLEFTIDDRTPASLPDSVEGTATLNDKNIYTLALVGGTLQITVTSSGGEVTQTIWKLVEDASDLKEGDQIVLVYGSAVNGGYNSSKYLNYITGVKVDSQSKTATLPEKAQVLTLGGQEGAWTFSIDGKILGATSAGNNTLVLQDKNSKWSITISGGEASIVNNSYSGSKLQCNVNSNQERFSNYKTGSQHNPKIYKATSASDEVKSDLEIAPAVYTTTVNSNQSNTGTSPILWISIVSVGAVLISLGAVVVIFALRKKSE